jgi:methylmalonyl-CoA mutase C-terminal domain/subunit
MVADVLRDAGFEVVMIGMANVDEIVRAAVDEDVDLIGLSIGGHVAVAERAIKALDDAGVSKPVFAGGVVPPRAKKRLEALGAEVYPPGSQPAQIVEAAHRLTNG